MTATAEALARIPAATIRNWPNAHLLPDGAIIAGHCRSCRTQGGNVSPAKCPRCSRHVEWQYRSALARLDSRARGR